MRERVGIFGGTFDPPHRAHLRVAQSACDELQLDRLLWIPAGRPPHKEGAEVTDPQHRLEMTRLMTDEDPRFRLELAELMSEDVSYTISTLERIHHVHPEWDLVLIMGEDQWAAFDAWHRPDEIRAMARVAVYRRPDTDERGKRQDAGAQPDHWLPGDSMSEASTWIRHRLQHGQAVDDMLLPAVEAYIQDQGLYT